MADPTYEERYCAFVDILGFSEIMAHLGSGVVSFETVRDLLRSVYKKQDQEYLGMLLAADLRSQSISDAVCLSAKVSCAGLMHLFAAIENLVLNLLYHGRFSRGAVVKGRLYHDGEIVFGEALVQAYHLETTVARYPRIMVTRDVALDVQSYLSDELCGNEFVNCVQRSSDGPYYFHVLRNIALVRDNLLESSTRFELIKYMNEAAQLIQERFDEAVDNPAHFEKVRWLAAYWNRTSADYDEVIKIEGAGLENWAIL